MGKITDKTKSTDNRINAPLCPGDSGIMFTGATLMSLMVAIAFTGIISFIASMKGISATEYSNSISESFGYNIFAYGLSSVSLFLTVLLFSFYKKQKPFKQLPFKKFGVKYLIIAVVLTFGMLFGFTELNNLFVSALEKLGYAKPDMTLPNSKWYEYLTWIILAAALPAFLEECVFRGYILEGFKGLKPAFVILFGGLLFSLFHQNPQQTPYQFICGAAFFLIAYKSGSVWPSIIMHFLNNFAIITSDFFFKGNLSQTAAIVLTVLGVLCFIGGIIYLVFFDKNSTGEQEISEESRLYHTKKEFFVYGAIGIAACLLMWFADLAAYGGLG